MEELLTTLLTVAELHEYKANPDRAARAPAWRPKCTRTAA